ALAFALVTLIAGEVAASADVADTLKPKLGPRALTIVQSHDYLRAHEAPDYWALSPYYLPQMTGSACSVATIATVLNALRGLPPLANDELVTQTSLLATVASEVWSQETAERGDGVTFHEFENYLDLSLKAFDLDAEVEVFKPTDASATTLVE